MCGHEGMGVAVAPGTLRPIATGGGGKMGADENR